MSESDKPATPVDEQTLTDQNTNNDFQDNRTEEVSESNKTNETANSLPAPITTIKNASALDVITPQSASRKGSGVIDDADGGITPEPGSKASGFPDGTDTAGMGLVHTDGSAQRPDENKTNTDKGMLKNHIDQYDSFF